MQNVVGVPPQYIALTVRIGLVVCAFAALWPNRLEAG